MPVAEFPGRASSRRSRSHSTSLKDANKVIWRWFSRARRNLEPRKHWDFHESSPSTTIDVKRRYAKNIARNRRAEGPSCGSTPSSELKKESRRPRCPSPRHCPRLTRHQLLLGFRHSAQERLHRRLAVAPPALMGPLLVELAEPVKVRRQQQVKTMGRVLVACLAARAVRVPPPVTMTSTLSSTPTGEDHR
jgi:hypothetical protein